jgi:hypothetical protein
VFFIGIFFLFCCCCLFIFYSEFFVFILFTYSFFSFYTMNITITIFSSQLSHPYSPSSSCAKIYCSPAQLLFLPLVIHSFPLSTPSPSILPQHVTTLPLLPTHSTPTDQPAIPTLHNPNSPHNKHPTLQQQKYTQIHTRPTKPSSFCTTSFIHPPHFLAPLLVLLP